MTLAPYRPVWFRSWGWVYRPVSSVGWMLVLLTLVFCGKAFITVDRLTHSVSDTLYSIYPYVVPSLMLLNWLASKTSGSRTDR